MGPHAIECVSECELAYGTWFRDSGASIRRAGRGASLRGRNALGSLSDVTAMPTASLMSLDARVFTLYVLCMWRLGRRRRRVHREGDHRRTLSAGGRSLCACVSRPSEGATTTSSPPAANLPSSSLHTFFTFPHQQLLSLRSFAELLRAFLPSFSATSSRSLTLVVPESIAAAPPTQLDRSAVGTATSSRLDTQTHPIFRQLPSVLETQHALLPLLHGLEDTLLQAYSIAALNGQTLRLFSSAQPSSASPGLQPQSLPAADFAFFHLRASSHPASSFSFDPNTL